MSHYIAIKISEKQFKELLNQFQGNSNFFEAKSKDSEYYAFTDKIGEAKITLYNFNGIYYLEISSFS